MTAGLTTAWSSYEMLFSASLVLGTGYHYKTAHVTNDNSDITPMVPV